MAVLTHARTWAGPRSIGASCPRHIRRTAISAVPGHRQECLCYAAGLSRYIGGGHPAIFPAGRPTLPHIVIGSWGRDHERICRPALFQLPAGKAHQSGSGFCNYSAAFTFSQHSQYTITKIILGSPHAGSEAGSNVLEMLEIQGVDVLSAAIGRAAQQQRIVNAAAGQALFRRFLDGGEVFTITE